MSQISKPLVTVLMGVYNCKDFVSEAISSILNQTYKNIEFLIIDDCSTDGTLEIINSFKTSDRRIRIIENKQNMGLGYSLNLGMNEAKGEFIARMDADDISHPNRFKYQVEFLIKHPHVACVGTSAKRIGDVNLIGKIFRVIHQKTSHDQIKAWLLIGTPMFHPSVMFNAKLIHRLGINYNPIFRRAQDYELWSRLAFQAKMANIDKPLHCYRYHKEMASTIASSEQRKNAHIIQSRIICTLIGRKPTEEEMSVHRLFAFGSNLSIAELTKIDKWLKFLLVNSCNSTDFEYKSIQELITVRRSVLIRNSVPSKILRLQLYFSDSELYRLSLRNILRLLK